MTMMTMILGCHGVALSIGCASEPAWRSSPSVGACLSVDLSTLTAASARPSTRCDASRQFTRHIQSRAESAAAAADCGSAPSRQFHASSKWLPTSLLPDATVSDLCQPTPSPHPYPAGLLISLSGSHIPLQLSPSL